MLQGLFGHGICFTVGAIFGISDCSNREDVPGEVRKAVILIRGILMFMVVAGVTTTAAVITTMQDKPQEDKTDLITTTTENDLTAPVSTTLATTEVNFTGTIFPTTVTTPTATTTTTRTTTTTTTTTVLSADAVLITGGSSDGIDGLKSAELYMPSSGASCLLPNMTDNYGRYGHTVESSGLVCGGGDTEYSCLQWSPDKGTWEKLGLTLDNERYGQVSWTPSPDIGTYLMGGSYSRTTNTLIKPDGTQETGFALKYDTA